MDAVVTFRQVGRDYRTAGGTVLRALRGVSGEVPPGRIVAITGRSGSGKSTLLHLAAGIDAPTSGEVLLLGRSLAALPDRERTRLRRDHVGLVFQFFHLLPHLSVEENVLVPALVAGDPLPAAAARPRSSFARGTPSRSSPAASGSASRCAGRCCAARGSCSPTSRPGTSTRRAARWSWTSCSGSRAARAARCSS